MPTLQPQSETEAERPEKKHRFSEASKEKIDPEIWRQVEAAFNEGFGLYIFGNVGTGKTFLCHAIKKENRDCKLINTLELLAKIKATFRNESAGVTESESEIIDEFSGESRWVSHPDGLLILDDIGVEKPSEWAQQTLFLIIDRRYQQLRKTVFTSNLSLDELSERLGDRITSRIADMCKVIEIKGKDRRVNK